MKSVIPTVKCREDDELFKTLSEELPVGVCVMQNGKFCYVNSTFPIAIGYTVDELVGKGSLEIVAPEDRETVKENTMKMLKGELSSPYQFRVTCKDGSIVWVMATVKPIQYHGKRATLGNYMEITERKLIEEALKEAEEEKSALLEEAPVGIIHTDLEGKITYVNKRFESESGYLREEIIGKEGLQLDWFPAGTTKYLAERMAARLRGDPAKHWETQFKCEDGHWIWIGLEGRMLRRLGVPVGFQIIASNITERKQAEEALRQSEERYRTMLEEMEEGYYEVDIAGNFTFVNDAMSRILGYSRDELIGMNYEIYTPKEDVKPIFQAYNRVYRTAEPLKWFPMPEIRKDGRRILAEHSVFPLWNEKGEVIGFRGISRDITERKQAVEALRQSEERYRTILEEMGDGYFETDLAGNLTLVNDAMIRFLGYSKEEMIGMNFRAFTPEEKVRTVFEAYNRMYRTGEPLCHLPTEVIRKDGGHRFAETSAFPIRNDRGEIVGFRGVRRDITARKQMEEALRHSEEKYRTILEEMEDSYFEVDLGGHLTFVNNSLCRDLGYSKEQLMGKSYKAFTAEEDIESVFQVFNEVYQTGVPNKGFPWKTIRKNGAHGFAETSISLLRNEQGETIGFRGVGRDITERKQAEEALRRSEERYRTILEEMEDAYFEVDLGGHLTFVNNPVCRDLGYSREELIGMSYKDFVAEDDIESLFRVFNKVYRSGVPNRGFPWKTIRKNGTHGFVETSISLLRNDKGEIIGFRGVGRDISERRKIMEALQQSEEKYRVLFDTSVIGTIVLDAETMKVAMVNQAAAKMFGFNSPEEAIGVNPLVFISPENREGILGIAQEDLFEQDSRQTYELRTVTKDGREIWINATGARIMHEGKLADLISFTDITEQKLQNERLMMTDRLASLGELASGTAHELNNPLTSIIGFSQLIMEREIPDDIREDLKLINTEAQRAANVTKNLLTFARKHAPVKQLSQINSIIEDVLKLRAYEHKLNNIAVVKQLHPNLPEMMVDYFQMQQVFMNIIINAEYFMTAAHKKGTLTITTRRQNSSVVVSFADDGPGIPPENLKRIFDPFFTTKEVGKGTGLGLSICHGIVIEHGGQIFARSQLGKGATVFVELPINGVQSYRSTR